MVVLKHLLVRSSIYKLKLIVNQVLTEVTFELGHVLKAERISTVDNTSYFNSLSNSEGFVLVSNSRF